MSQPPPSPLGGPPREVPVPARDANAELQQRIRRTREELGETVAALTAKTHLRSRAEEKAAELGERVLRRGAALAENPWPATLFAAADRTVSFTRRHATAMGTAGIAVITLTATALALRGRSQEQSVRRGQKHPVRCGRR